jgi:hypothetical protein
VAAPDRHYAFLKVAADGGERVLVVLNFRPKGEGVQVELSGVDFGGLNDLRLIRALMEPASCRVAAKLTPSSDSDIQIEVWLPALAWNGKVPGRWQRRLGGRHQLWRDGLRAAGGLRDGIDRHGARRCDCDLRARTSGKGHRFRGG